MIVSTTATEQRQTLRKVLKVRAMLAIDGHPVVPARTFDIGGAGMGITVPNPINANLSGNISFEVFLDGQPTVITAKIKVAYCIFSGGDYKIGLNFVNLELSSMSLIAKFMR